MPISHLLPQTSTYALTLRGGPHLPLAREIQVIRQDPSTHRTNSPQHTHTHLPQRQSSFLASCSSRGGHVPSQSNSPPTCALDPTLWSPREHPSRCAQASPIFSNKSKSFLQAQLHSLLAPCVLSPSEPGLLEELTTLALLTSAPPASSSAPLRPSFLPHRSPETALHQGAYFSSQKHFSLLSDTFLSLGFSGPIFLASLLPPKSSC